VSSGVVGLKKAVYAWVIAATSAALPELPAPGELADTDADVAADVDPAGVVVEAVLCFELLHEAIVNARATAVTAAPIRCKGLIVDILLGRCRQEPSLFLRHSPERVRLAGPGGRCAKK
jgi:hypothetical protein